MNLSDIGLLLQSSYKEYVGRPAEELGRKVVEKYPGYKQFVNNIPSGPMLQYHARQLGDQIKQGYRSAYESEPVQKYLDVAQKVSGPLMTAVAPIEAGIDYAIRKGTPEEKYSQLRGEGPNLMTALESRGVPGSMALPIGLGASLAIPGAGEASILNKAGDVATGTKLAGASDDVVKAVKSSGINILKSSDDELLSEWSKMEKTMDKLDPRTEDFRKIMVQRQDIGDEFMKRTGTTTFEALEGKSVKAQEIEPNLGEDAIKKWMETDNPEMGAYLTREGKMIDGSGRVQASESNWVYMTDRSVDHREIASDFSTKDGSQGMFDFMDRSGAIRMDVMHGNQANFDVMRKPTKKQLDMINDLADGKEIYFDLTRPNGNTYKSGGPIEVGNLLEMLNNDVLYGIGLIFSINAVNKGMSPNNTGISTDETGD